MCFDNSFQVQFNPMSAKPSEAGVSPTALSQPSNKENGGPVGLDPKYFERRDDSIPLRGLLPSMHLNREVPKPLNTAGAKPTASAASAYFPG